MQIKDRIDEFILFKNLSDSAFEKEIGLSNGLWRKAKSVSEEVLIKVIEHFPEIDEVWLLRGQGSMIKADNIEPRLEDVPNSELLQLCRSLVENYQQRDEVMGKLVSMVKGLE